MQAQRGESRLQNRVRRVRLLFNVFSRLEGSIFRAAHSQARLTTEILRRVRVAEQKTGTPRLTFILYYKYICTIMSF